MKKLILNRNKKQLQRIIEWRIQERKDVFKKFPELQNDYTEERVLDGKVSILRWVLEVLENPKKWDYEFKIQKDDVEIFETIKN